MSEIKTESLPVSVSGLGTKSPLSPNRGGELFQKFFICGMMPTQRMMSPENLQNFGKGIFVGNTEVWLPGKGSPQSEPL
jgi:hypothetical protein